MRKELRIKIVSYVIASAIAFINSFALMFSSVSFAEDTAPFTSVSPYLFGSDGWQSAPTNLIALRDAFYKTYRTQSFSDILIGNVYDIPLAWVKTVNDSQLYLYCICPLDDVYYYLDTEGNLCIYDPNHRSGRSGGGGVNRFVSSSDDFVFSSAFFKDKVDYWSDYYKPKDNPSQYVYSYNDGNSNKSYSNHNFVPYCPVYTSAAGSSTAWGMKGWSGGVYILPFYDDDDLTYVYYGKYYFHIYTNLSDNGSVTIFMDTISLTDGSIYNSCSSAWDSNYNTLAFSLTSKPFLYHYTSYFNYLSAATGSNGTWFLNVNSTVPGTMVSGSLSSLSSVNLWDIKFSSTTFDPVNNFNDDFGYIVSSEPFDLWVNHGIDLSKIPDNYYITYGGDNIYNYTITDPSTGNGTTINNYITNNYIISDDSDGGDTINNWNISFGDFLVDIGNTIQTSITAVFVPSDVVLESYHTQLTDTLNAKLPFINDLGDILNSLFVDIRDGNIIYSSDSAVYASSLGDPASDIVDNSDLFIYPKWTINLSFFGQDMELTVLDFALYADSLFYVRIVVAAFVYLAWFINVYRYLPKLIGGVGDMTNSVLSISSNYKDGDE